MRPKKIIIDKNTLLIAYKLLYDLLFLLLITFALILTAEGVLPGLVSSKISFSKVIILIFLTLASIAYLGKNLHITYSEKKINKIKILPILILFSFLLIGNSLLKFSFWENIIITLTTLFVFFLLYEIIYTTETN